MHGDDPPCRSVSQSVSQSVSREAKWVAQDRTGGEGVAVGDGVADVKGYTLSATLAKGLWPLCGAFSLRPSTCSRCFSGGPLCALSLLRRWL